MTHSSDDRRYAWRVLSVTGIGVLLSGANTSTLDVALPTVARHFNATATEASWMLLSYMLVNTGLIVAFGRLADIVGRRRLYLAGLAVFTVGGLACGFATNAAELDAMQAVGAASIVTNTTALLTDAFPPETLSLGLGLNVTLVSAAQVVGPLLGGLLATTLGWRAVFWFNVPTGAVGLVWAAISLRRSPRSGERREPFDLIGGVLSFAVLGSLVIALSEGGALGWTSPPVVAGAIVFAVTTRCSCSCRRAAAIRWWTCGCSPTRSGPWPTSRRSCCRWPASPWSSSSRCTCRPPTASTRSRPVCA